MKHTILIVITCFAIAGVAIGADTPPQKSVTPKAATPASKKAAPMAVKRHTTTTASRTPPRTPQKTTTQTASNKRYNRAQPIRRSYAPQQPTADRYREIQDALAAKGYLKTPSSGVWDKDSIDAMQRFQQDQKLEPTGKLTAKSLGALGLGPKTPIVSLEPEARSSGEASPVQ